ncbi:hypothetical protein V1284_000562 [Nitrobacteraceae bacterium AZCC 2299]
MTAAATRRRSIGQILLLAAGFLVLTAISTASVLLVDRAREDSGLVVHTVEVENQISTLLLEIRRAESAGAGLSADLQPAISCRARKRCRRYPSRHQQARPIDPRQSGRG